MKLALDAMGGDNAPQINIDGAKLALQEVKGLETIYLVGREEELRPLCAAAGILDNPRVELVHASEVVGMGESGKAVRQKKDSSMCRAVELVRRGQADAVLSAGNTGAAVTASTLLLGRLPGVKFPGIVSPLPSVHGHVLLTDTGANPDAEPKNLVVYGIFAAMMARYIYNRPAPKVGIMSNGTEEGKGCAKSKETFKLMSALATKGILPFEFIGNCEGHDIFETELDAAVMDGFTGNILLKTAEATVKVFTHWMKAGIKSSVPAMAGALLMKGVFSRLNARLNPDKIGGSTLMGVNGVSIIAHGSANGEAILNAIRMAEAMCRHSVNDKIIAALERVNPAIAELESEQS